MAAEPDVEAAQWMHRIHNFERVLEAPPIPPKFRKVHKLRVPQEQREVNPDAYTPKILFLGFKNRRNPVEDLGVDNYKVEWARQFLAWKADSESEEEKAGMTLGSGVQSEGLGEQWTQFVQALKIDVQLARSTYEIRTHMAPEVIEKVLAMDALFLLLLILRVPRHGILPDKFFGPESMTQPHQFGYGYPWGKLFSDMFLLENQVPLYILLRVWRAFPGHSNSVELPLKDLLYHRFVYLFPEVTSGSSKAPVMEVISKISYERCDNLLHCLLKLICYNPRPRGKKHYEGALSIPSASAMRNVGIQCACEGITFLHEVHFDQARACLMLPRIKIQNWTEVYMRNLVALETTVDYPGMLTDLATYLTLLDDLVDNEEDVKLLETNGVMSHLLGSALEVAQVCNNVAIHVGIAQSTDWAQMLRVVNDRCKSRNHRLLAELKNRYCSRPWFTISLVAAIILLLMTALQTLYSVLSYY